jgi:release factor glutamine methyltransferase
MQLARFYQETVKKLALAGIEEAESDAALLLCFCLGLSRSELFLRDTLELTAEQLEECRALVTRRRAREPLHYITGTREFWSLDFVVSPAVLIPRPETEFLLELVLKTFSDQGSQDGAVLDMCTGSGVIAVVMALELGAKNIIAVDRSKEALHVAAENIFRHGKVKEICLLCSDLFSAVSPQAQFACIVANPPYVPAGELESLQPEVRNWEPGTALAAGEKGLDVVEKLADQASEYLMPGGWLFLEIGADQKESVQSLFADHPSGAYGRVEIIHDWAGRPRVLKTLKKG